MDNKNIESVKVLELIAVAAEYCSLVENADKYSQKSFISRSVKLLALLYLKASLVEVEDEEPLEYIEKFVTEQDWNYIQSKVCLKLGENESYFDLQEPLMYGTDEAKVNVSTSECFADIYQDLRDLLEAYRIGGSEEQKCALAECVVNFKTFWGVRLILLLNELHLLLNSNIELDDSCEDELSEINED
jgi:hypothetical protein